MRPYSPPRRRRAPWLFAGLSRSSAHLAGLLPMYSRWEYRSSSSRMMCSWKPRCQNGCPAMPRKAFTRAVTAALNPETSDDKDAGGRRRGALRAPATSGKRASGRTQCAPTSGPGGPGHGPSVRAAESMMIPCRWLGITTNASSVTAGRIAADSVHSSDAIAPHWLRRTSPRRPRRGCPRAGRRRSSRSTRPPVRSRTPAAGLTACAGHRACAPRHPPPTIRRWTEL